jgi:hypothetical protein
MTIYRTMQLTDTATTCNTARKCTSLQQATGMRKKKVVNRSSSRRGSRWYHMTKSCETCKQVAQDMSPCHRDLFSFPYPSRFIIRLALIFWARIQSFFFSHPPTPSFIVSHVGVEEILGVSHWLPHPGYDITVYWMVPFKEHIQCAERFGFAGPHTVIGNICIVL